MTMYARRKIGVVGFGNLGQYLVREIISCDDLELVFVWNRTTEVMKGFVPSDCVLHKLDDFSQRKADLIVEVAHPSITSRYGEIFLEHSDYMIGSPTALADLELETRLRTAAVKHGLYVPRGALWGSDDIKKMADRKSLGSVKITMTKHPRSFKLNGDLKTLCESVVDTKTVLYDGPVRELCPLAPNNVNTMAATCLAAHTLGFDRVQGSIVADPNLHDWHIVEIEVKGVKNENTGQEFHCKTVRSNPSKVGHVTGSATYASFLGSLLEAHGRGSGVHIC